MGNSQGEDLLYLWDTKRDKLSKLSNQHEDKFQLHCLPHSGWEGMLASPAAQG